MAKAHCVVQVHLPWYVLPCVHLVAWMHAVGLPTPSVDSVASWAVRQARTICGHERLQADE